jgi:3-deoxy-manno-octulosonate cytidylyltransferase (CMP-KDO synthetase)
MEEVVGVIPARYNSTRLPGKPLADIGGKPMIQWVWEQVRKSRCLSRLIVATDDERIEETVLGFGGVCVMTPGHLKSGTDRVAWAARPFSEEIVVNIQGDEPFIEPANIDLVAGILLDNPDAVMGTLVKKLTDYRELISPNTAKVVMNSDMNAMYFSRSPVPFYRDGTEPSEWPGKAPYYKQIGIYSYRRDFLQQFAGWEATPLEKAEKLEQLRVLERGFSIQVAETFSESICVDTPEDLETARKIAGAFTQ